MAKKGHKGKRKKALAELAPTPVQTMPAHLRPRRAHVYDLDRQTEHVALNVLKAAAPGLQYLTTRYPRKWLRKDVIAGVAVAAYMVPQVLAYSAIVNVPPVAGLWSALAAIIAYAVMGGSRVLSAGPESTIALMAGAAIAPLAGGDPQRALSLSAALCLIVAGWCLVARVFRAGIVVELLSQPLLVGYLAGGAVLMIVGQLGRKRRRRWARKAGLTSRPALLRALRVILTFNLISFAWIFFRAPTLSKAFTYLHFLQLKINPSGWNFLLVGVLLILALLGGERLAAGRKFSGWWARRPLPLRGAALALFVCLIILFAVDTGNEFIYIQF